VFCSSGPPSPPVEERVVDGTLFITDTKLSDWDHTAYLSGILRISNYKIGKLSKLKLHGNKI